MISSRRNLLALTGAALAAPTVIRPAAVHAGDPRHQPRPSRPGPLRDLDLKIRIRGSPRPPVVLSLVAAPQWKSERQRTCASKADGRSFVGSEVGWGVVLKTPVARPSDPTSQAPCMSHVACWSSAPTRKSIPTTLPFSTTRRFWSTADRGGAARPWPEKRFREWLQVCLQHRRIQGSGRCRAGDREHIAARAETKRTQPIQVCPRLGAARCSRPCRRGQKHCGFADAGDARGPLRLGVRACPALVI